MHSVSILSDRASVGFSQSAASAPGLSAGGRDTGSWTGQADKAPRLQQPHSRLLCQMQRREDRRLSLNPGWKRPLGCTAVGLCVHPLEPSQAEKAQQQGDHGTALCQLQGNHSSLTEIKLSVCFRWIAFSKQDFHLLSFYNISAAGGQQWLKHHILYRSRKEPGVHSLKTLLLSAAMDTGLIYSFPSYNILFVQLSWQYRYWSYLLGKTMCFYRLKIGEKRLYI